MLYLISFELKKKVFIFILYNLNIFVYQVVLLQVLYYLLACCGCGVKIFIYKYFAIVFIIYMMFLIQELVFPTNIILTSTISIVRILLLLFVMHSEKIEKFNGLNSKW
jgi:hypothetical protein